MIDPTRNYTAQDDFIKRKKMAEEWELMKEAQAEESRARNEAVSKKAFDKLDFERSEEGVTASLKKQKEFAQDPVFARLKYDPTTTDQEWEKYYNSKARMAKDREARRNKSRIYAPDPRNP